MARVAFLIAALAVAGAVVSFLVGAVFYARAQRLATGIVGPLGWLRIAVWPFAIGRVRDTADVALNKAVVALLTFATVAVAAGSVATNLERLLK